MELAYRQSEDDLQPNREVWHITQDVYEKRAEGRLSPFFASRQLNPHLADISRTTRQQVEWMMAQLLERHPGKAIDPLC